MPHTPRVSIVLPTYNGERFLKQSVQSIINQEFTDWELIIVNDCSTDNTPKIIKEFASQDSRIKIINNKTNKKLPASLNIGFASACGKYFTWTSDDNIAQPNWIGTLVNVLESDKTVSMVVADMDYIDENDNSITTASERYPNRNVKQLAYICNVGAAFMYRKTVADMIGLYDESTFCAEDYDYWCRIALNGKIKYIPNNIYRYRRHGGSLTETKKEQQIAKTVGINKKYYAEFISKYKFNWWQRQKLMFLLYPNVPKTRFYWLLKCYKNFTFQLINVLFFWHTGLRHKFKSYLKIKL